MQAIYLDWAATAKPWPDIAAASSDIAIDAFGNPSSAHGAGRAAKAILEESRKRLGLTFGGSPDPVYFTSGGSESDSIVMLSTLMRSGERSSERSVVISGIEHSAIHEQAAALERFGVKVIRVMPRPDGRVDPSDVAAAMFPDTVLVSIMAVNNETGAIQDLAAIGRAIHSAPTGRTVLFHSDAVQAFCKLAIRPMEIGLDAVSVSAQKLGGPRGVGALWLRKPIPVVAKGGGQESGIRSGTHNVAGAWALSMAAERSMAGMDVAFERARALESRLINGARAISGSVILPFGRDAGDVRYSPYIVNVAFPGLGGETMARALDDEGVYVSTGAACSGSAKGRRVFDAMGIPQELSFSSIRVSFGRDSLADDVDRFLETAARLYARYRT